VPAPLGAEQKQQLVKAALPGYVAALGVSAPLRLDPKVVYVPGKAHLSLDGVEEMYPNQGFALFSPSTVVFGAGLTVSFKPSTADRPVLVDYALHQAGAGTVGVVTYPSSPSQTVTLSDGDHHVSLVVQPADTGWFSVRLNFYEAPASR
jgi:hypothetical protein